MSFTSVAKELRRDALTMLETHIVMSSLIFHLVLTLVLCLTLLLVPCLISLMDLTIAHMILVHERTNLCLDALVTAWFSAGGSHTHLEPRHFDGPHFSRHGSRPTRSNGEVQRTMKTSSNRMVK
jgi:hypothetical protein